jgi:probable phosphoglycerate mutase
MSTGKTGELFNDEPNAPRESSKVMVAHIDGGSRGNPGPSGYGAYITDSEGKRIAELSEFLGVQTNNFAEYSGLVAALEYAVEHGYGTVKAVSDSELLVKQMKGQYHVRSEALLAIYGEAKALVRKLDRFEIRHVLRHLNKDADRLANAAMHEAAQFLALFTIHRRLRISVGFRGACAPHAAVHGGVCQPVGVFVQMP